MHKSLIPGPITALKTPTFLQSLFTAIRKWPMLFGGLLTLLVATYASAATSTLSVTSLNSAIKTGLTQGRDAGKSVACSALTVFFDNNFIFAIFGIMLLFSITAALIAWWRRDNRGESVSRTFMLIIVVTAFIGIVGVLMSVFINCP